MIRVVAAAAANINDDAAVAAFIITATGVWAIRVEYGNHCGVTMILLLLRHLLLLRLRLEGEIIRPDVLAFAIRRFW